MMRDKRDKNTMQLLYRTVTVWMDVCMHKGVLLLVLGKFSTQFMSGWFRGPTRVAPLEIYEAFWHGTVIKDTDQPRGSAESVLSIEIAFSEHASGCISFIWRLGPRQKAEVYFFIL